MPSPAPKHMLYWLVVHGSYGPGGSDHHQLAGLDGTWHPGSFSGVAGPSFSDLMVQRFGGAPVPSWALQIAPRPASTDEASDSDGNTAAQLFDRWADIDELFPPDVTRADTTFHFDSSHASEGDVCRANTYGSNSMIPDGQYDPAHPNSTLVELWSDTVNGSRIYEPSMFKGLLAGIQPEEVTSLFADLPQGEQLIERLGIVMTRRPMAVTEADVLGLAMQSVQLKSAVVMASNYRGTADLASAVDQLDYRIADSQPRAELGDIHYDLAEGFADACDYTDVQPWSAGLSEACYALTSSHDVVCWLTQAWRQPDLDLAPLYNFWNAGGDVAIDIDGVAHVTVGRPPDSA